MNIIPFRQIEQAGRKTHLRESISLLNTLNEATLLSLDIFSWDGLLTIAKLSPSLSVLREKMKTLESKGFSGVPFVSSSRKF